MSVRSRSSLARVLDDLGATLLELLRGDVELASPIAGIHIHDSFGQIEPPLHALVLGVGVHQPARIVDLLSELGGREAAALVVRLPAAVDADVAAAVDGSGVALLGLTPGASWAQLVAVLGTLLAEFDIGEAEPQTLGGLPFGDLFAVANAAAALIDAPVTIEDRASRVLAFSGRQDEADPARVATILGRQVPAEAFGQLAERGVYEKLQRQTGPVYTGPLTLSSGELSLPRVAVAVRAGSEFLGSIWAAVTGPLNEERMSAFGDAAKLVALHLLRVRAGADVERRLRTDLVGTALEGGIGGTEAIARLGLIGRPSIVMALSLPEGPTTDDTAENAARSVAEQQHLSDAFAMHLGALHPRSAVAPVGQVTYAILPSIHTGHTATENAVRSAQAFLDRSRSRALIGVGRPVNDTAGLAQSRTDADRALRVLLAGGTSSAVATVDDVHFDALLLEFAELAAARGPIPVGPIARLVAYDARHNSYLVETLRHWLDAFGAVPAAAAVAFVHPNTFRYRLRRLAQVGEINLAAPDERFAAMLQLRLLTLHGGAGAIGPPSEPDGAASTERPVQKRP